MMIDTENLDPDWVELDLDWVELDPDWVELDPNWVELDPDCVDLSPDLVSAGLAGQGVPERGRESLGEAVMEAVRLWRPDQLGGEVWRLRGASRKLGKQVGR
jgi:hypothetical protein